MTETLLQLQDVKKHFPVISGLVFGCVQAWVKAVDGVSLAIGKGETLGLVGESGCGKTTTARLILRQEEVTAGSITFHGRDLNTLQKRDLLDYRKSVHLDHIFLIQAIAFIRVGLNGF
jgi:ABC-type oligopeptide transport system ATPase subunit